MNICFIILNYNTANETITLINSIYEHQREKDQIRIIIVDNASTDKSLKVLNEVYRDNELITICESQTNMGFSRANNWGYKEMLTYRDVDFCIVSNSDVLITQDDFFEKIEKEYIVSNFGILGPDVRVKENNSGEQRHQSPLYPHYNSKKYVVYHYKKSLIRLEHNLKIWNPFYCFKRVIYGLVRIFYQLIEKYQYNNYWSQRHEDVPVCGAFIILSPIFMNKIECLFYPETFFYGEEILLFYTAQREKIKTVYSPEIYVEHLQGEATKKVNTLVERQNFILNNLVSSDLVILKEMLNKK